MRLDCTWYYRIIVIRFVGTSSRENLFDYFPNGGLRDVAVQYPSTKTRIWRSRRALSLRDIGQQRFDGKDVMIILECIIHIHGRF